MITDNTRQPLLSIVVPVYNEYDVLPVFYEEIRKQRSGQKLDWELVFVNDGSRDQSLDRIRTMAAADPHVKYISFSRNFGKEAAMLAGLRSAKGDLIAVMDADLQDPPAMLDEMAAAVMSGEYDCAAARRVSRKGEPPLRSFFAHAFYKLINRISDVEIVDGARDFRLMTRPMVDAILRVGEYNRFSKGIFSWVGFRTKWIPYENVERACGQTKWSFWGLMKYAIDGIINFSQAPLSIASWFGVIMTILSFAALLFIIVRKLIFGDPVDGWASTACIIIFMGGIQLFCMGIMGQYLAKIYMESKHRPHYIIAECNTESRESET